MLYPLSYEGGHTNTLVGWYAWQRSGLAGHSPSS